MSIIEQVPVIESLVKAGALPSLVGLNRSIQQQINFACHRRRFFRALRDVRSWQMQWDQSVACRVNFLNWLHLNEATGFIKVRLRPTRDIMRITHDVVVMS